MIHTVSLSLGMSCASGKNNDISSQSQQDATNTIIAVRFWTDQLKYAILIRYGKLGNTGSINIVRELLRHTKHVLRQKEGLDHVANKFI
jgi:hypothetical protein